MSGPSISRDQGKLPDDVCRQLALLWEADSVRCGDHTTLFSRAPRQDLLHPNCWPRIGSPPPTGFLPYTPTFQLSHLPVGLRANFKRRRSKTETSRLHRPTLSVSRADRREQTGNSGSFGFREKSSKLNITAYHMPILSPNGHQLMKTD
jgi:hypothetical protein